MGKPNILSLRDSECSAILFFSRFSKSSFCLSTSLKASCRRFLILVMAMLKRAWHCAFDLSKTFLFFVPNMLLNYAKKSIPISAIPHRNGAQRVFASLWLGVGMPTIRNRDNCCLCIGTCLNANSLLYNSLSLVCEATSQLPLFINLTFYNFSNPD